MKYNQVNILTSTVKVWQTVSILAIVLTNIVVDSSLRAQTVSQPWSELMQRREGWLGADGIYSIRLRFDAASSRLIQGEEENYLWLFSDTIYGSTKENGAEYDSIHLVNHSFALLNGTAPDPSRMDFLWHNPNNATSNANPITSPPHNVIEGHYWLQDGIRYQDSIWLTAILVGKAWKPQRIDVVKIPLNPETRQPDFANVCVDKSTNLSLQADDKQLALGAAICDDSEDDFIYIFGYVDYFRQHGRKDAVVARAPRSELSNYSAWQFYCKGIWSSDINALLEPTATIVSNVSTEFSVSKIPYGKYRGKWLLVYTPGVISERIAFRVGDSPVGPFGEEHIFYRSDVPQRLPGVHCYNAKAHPSFATEKSILVSYNVNRLGELAKRPDEYRPRFIELTWKTIEEAEDTKQ